MPPNHEEPVDPGKTVTHVGSVDRKGTGKWHRLNYRFQCLLDDGEDEMSVFVGRLSVEQAIDLLTLGVRASTPTDAVRYAQAGDLLGEGFRVCHTPEMVEEHVSVKWPEV